MKKVWFDEAWEDYLYWHAADIMMIRGREAALFSLV